MERKRIQSSTKYRIGEHCPVPLQWKNNCYNDTATTIIYNYGNTATMSKLQLWQIATFNSSTSPPKADF